MCIKLLLILAIMLILASSNKVHAANNKAQ